jgi:hypothetical protein
MMMVAVDVRNQGWGVYDSKYSHKRTLLPAMLEKKELLEM